MYFVLKTCPFLKNGISKKIPWQCSVIVMEICTIKQNSEIFDQIELLWKHNTLIRSSSISGWNLWSTKCTAKAGIYCFLLLSHCEYTHFPLIYKSITWKKHYSSYIRTLYCLQISSHGSQVPFFLYGWLPVKGFSWRNSKMGHVGFLKSFVETYLNIISFLLLFSIHMSIWFFDLKNAVALFHSHFSYTLTLPNLTFTTLSHSHTPHSHSFTLL